MLAPPGHSITAAGRCLLALALAFDAGAGLASASSGLLRVALLISGDEDAERSKGFTVLFKEELDRRGAFKAGDEGDEFSMTTAEYRVADKTEALQAVEMADIGRDLNNQTTVLGEGAHVLVTFSGMPWVEDIIDLCEELHLPNIHTYAGDPLLYKAKNDHAFGIQLPYTRLHEGSMSWARLNGMRTAAIVRSASGNFYKANGLSSLVWAQQASLKLIGPSLDWCRKWSNLTSTCSIVDSSPRTRGFSAVQYSSQSLSEKICRCGEEDILQDYGLFYNLKWNPSFYEVDEAKLIGSQGNGHVVYDEIVKFNRGIIEDIQAQLEHADYVDVLSSWVKSRWSLMAALKEADVSPKMFLAHGEFTMDAKTPDGSPALTMRDGLFQMDAVQWHRNMSVKDPLLGDTDSFVKLYSDKTGKALDNGPASAAAAGVVIYLGVTKYSTLTTSMDLPVQRKRLRKAIRSVNDETLFGHVRFNTFSQNDGRDLVVFQRFPVNSTSGASEGIVVLGLDVASRTIMTFPSWGAREGCPPGQRNTGDLCQACESGTYNPDVTRPLAVTSCHRCGKKHVSHEGATSCHECFDGQRASDDGKTCLSNPSFYALIAVAAAFIWIAVHLLVVTLWYPCGIADIYQADNKIILKTNRTHYWSLRGRSSLSVRIEGTGHPCLDKPQLFRVRSETLQTMQLFDADGKPLTERADASQGTVRLHGCLAEAMHVGFVPLAILVPFCFVGTAGTLFFSEVTAEHELVIVLGAAVAGLLTGCLWRKRCLLKVGPLQKLLYEFERSLREKNPKPEPCPRGPSRGVALGDVMDLFQRFEMFVRDRNMYYMFANILMPLTKSHKLSYAEVVGPKPLQWFVSHFWGTPFRHFCESIQKHAEATMSLTDSTSSSSMAYWICSLSNNQWHVDDELSETLEQSSFYLALWSETCKGVCMVLDSEATPLKRSWCLFEVLQTSKLEQTRKGVFAGLLFCTSIGCLNHGFASTDVVMALGHRIAQLSLKDAHATSERDRSVIEERVSNEPGGFPAMDQFVRQRIRKALEAAHEHVEGEFHRILGELPPTSDAVENCDSDRVGQVVAPGASNTSPVDYATFMDGKCVSIDL